MSSPPQRLPDAVDAARNRRFERGLRSFLLSIVTSLFLIALKGTVGVIAHSQGLVADAVHSGADLAAALVGLSSMLVSRHPADAKHPYGHGRAEAVAANFAAMVIGAAGLLVLWESGVSLVRGGLEVPGVAALLVACVVGALKLGLSAYSLRVARAIHSKAVFADARDHLTDVASAAAVAAGIAGARLGAPVLDPLAGVCVGLFILYTALEVFRTAVHELMDTSLSPELRSAVIEEARLVSGITITGVAGRTIGDRTLVELHGEVESGMTVAEASTIVDAVKSRLLARVTDIQHVVVELNSGIYEPEALRLTLADETPPAMQGDSHLRSSRPRS